MDRSPPRLPFSVAVLDMDWHLVDIDPRFGNGWTGYTWTPSCSPICRASWRSCTNEG